MNIQLQVFLRVGLGYILATGSASAQCEGDQWKRQDPRQPAGNFFATQQDCFEYERSIQDQNRDELGDWLDLAGQEVDLLGRAAAYQATQMKGIEEARLLNEQARLTNEQARFTYAQSRLLFAESFDRELDLWVKRIRTRDKARTAAIEGKMQVKDAYDKATDHFFLRQRKNAQRRWEVMKNHPELAGADAENGSGLNFLVNRFHGTPVGYGYPLDQIFNRPIEPGRFDISPEILSQLRVTTNNAGMGATTFRLDDPSRIDSELPYLLGDEVFREYTDAYRQQRKHLMDLSFESKRLTNEQIKEYADTIDRLKDAFEVHYPRGGSRYLDQSLVYQIIDCRRFFDRCASSLRNIQTSGSAIPKGFDARGHREIKDVVSLVSFMTRTGVRFAPANSPDHQAAYRQLFEQMGELYSEVAEVIDESLPSSTDTFDDFEIEGIDTAGANEGGIE